VFLSGRQEQGNNVLSSIASPASFSPSLPLPTFQAELVSTCGGLRLPLSVGTNTLLWAPASLDCGGTLLVVASLSEAQELGSIKIDDERCWMQASIGGVQLDSEVDWGSCLRVAGQELRL